MLTLIHSAFAALLVLGLPLASADGGAVSYDLDLTWMQAAPDGVQKTVIGVNGQWPPPVLYANAGQLVTVNVANNLGNQSSSIHFHGMFQNGTTYMDGAVGATQCAIPAGSRFTYNFTANSNAGTYWYHSHLQGQYPEGLRAPFIIRDPHVPFTYDEELVMSLSDWYHESMPVLTQQFLSVGNPTGAEPVPNSALMNDTQALKVNVQPGKTYFIRLVNVGAFAGQRFWIEGHTMRIVEVDGTYTQPQEADMLYLSVAQRYSILVTTKNDTSANFPMVTSMDTDLFDTIPQGLQWNNTGWLVYDNSKPTPAAADVTAWNDFDDMKLVPSDGLKQYGAPGTTVELTVQMQDLGNGVNYAFLNGNTYVAQKVPTLFSAMTLGDAAANATVYGVNSNSYVLDRGQIIDIVVNNHDTGKHPFHLHGHHFQMIERSEPEAGDAPSNYTDSPAVPVRRDTFTLMPNGYARIRFIADNPGVWLFHCHIEWHTISGLIATMVEAPIDLQKETIPQDHYAACKKLNIPTAGNAAGNTVNPYDLSGANTSPAPLPSGFTARGIVALVFSCVAAFLGLAVISWYGYAPIKK